MSWPRSIAILTGLALLVAGCATTAATGSPTLTSTTSSATVTSAAPTTTAGTGSITIGLPADWLTDGLRVAVSAGGGTPLRMLVDTGSNGVVLARKDLGTAVEELSPRQTFSDFTYSSSGNSYSGEWVRTTLTFGSVNGGAALATTSPILVRAVDRMCAVTTGSGRAGDKAKVCTSYPARIDVAMLGVGFDRAADRSAAPANSGPAINPFLHLSQMDAGTMTRGYIVGSGRLVLGPTAADMAPFTAVALQRTTGDQPADWQAPTSCVSVAGSVSPQCGPLLLDTGLGYAIIQAPTGVQPPTVPAASTQGRPTVQAGQQVSISIPSLPNPVYRFTVGAAGAPQSVQWGHLLDADRPFMNISRFALSQTDYLYDATDGRVGFRSLTS